MNYPDDDGDDLFNLNFTDAYGIDDHNSPLGDNPYPLQVPFRESPPSPSRDLDDGLYSGFSDPSLSIPMREMQFSSTEPSRLSPPLTSYSNDNVDYGGNVQMGVPYNSFEQPVAVVNGDFSLNHAMDSPLHTLDQQNYYSQEPSTSQPSSIQQQHPQQQQQPQQQVVNNNQQRSSTVQRILSTPRATPPQQGRQVLVQRASAPRQRPIQPKTNNRRKTTGTVGEVLSNAHRINSSNGAQTSNAVRLSPEQLMKLASVASELAMLEKQQEELGIDNRGRIDELKKQQAQIFIEAVSQQNGNTEVLNQLQQIQQHPGGNNNGSQQRSNNNQRNRSHMDMAPDSPQYEPQIYNMNPSTSHAIYSDYPPTSVTTVVSNPSHQQPPQQQPQQQQQRQIYRLSTRNLPNVEVTSTYQTPQQPPVYLQPVEASYGQPGPTVGQVIRQNYRPVLAKPSNAPRQVIVQHMPSHQMPVTSVAPPPVIVQRPQPPRPNPAQVARRIEDKRASRLNRLKEALGKMHESIAYPNTEQPFTDLSDVLCRLLPYHQYLEPDIQQAELDEFDSNYIRNSINLNDRRKLLERRFRNVLFSQAMKSAEEEEKNLLLFLDGEYEKRTLESEKTAIANGSTDPESFVNTSTIIPALRGHPLPKLETKNVNLKMNYDYHPFDETPRVFSPYRSPSPPKSISTSPLKSPRLRIRSSGSTSSSIASKGMKSPRSHVKPHVEVHKQPSESHKSVKTARENVKEAANSHHTVVVKQEKSPIKEPAKGRSSHAVDNKTESSRLPRLKSPSIERKVDVKTEIIVETKPANNKRKKSASKSEVVPPTPPPVSPPKRNEPKKSSKTPVKAPPRPHLPTKKEILSRVRKEKSPSKDISVVPVANGVETDGSCSPELGLDEEEDRPGSALVTKELTPVVEPTPPPVVKTVPVPPPLPVKKTVPTTTPTATPEFKLRFKPQVPRPVKQHVETKPVIPTNEVVKEVDFKQPPLKLKIKRSILAVENPSEDEPETPLEVEPVDHADEKRERKKKKKKKRKRRMESREGHKKSRKEVEYRAEPTAALKLVLRPKPGPSNESIRPGSVSSLENQEPEPTKITLKIKLGPPPAAEPSNAGRNVPPVRLSSIGVPPSGSKLPSIDFSDDSDSDAERLRSSTDEALRGCGLNSLGINSISNSTLLPWSSQP